MPSTLPPISRAPAAVSHAPTEAHIAAGLRALARLLAPLIAPEITLLPANDREEWIDQGCSPLGRRMHCAAARDGRLTARKVGRKWLVRRADLEAFILRHGKPSPDPVTVETADLADDERIRALLAECGAERCATSSTPKRAKRDRASRGAAPK